MSLYHCNMKPVKRSEGKCAVHSAAYFRGAKMYDQRTGTTTDYRDKKEVIYSRLFANKDALEWVQELIKSEEFASGEDKNIASEILWNKAEMHNVWKRSQLANIWTIALQKELTIEQNIEIVEKIAKTLASDGTVVDANIHWEPNNPHAHFLEAQNFLTEDGFGLKNRYLNSRERLGLVRKEVANTINRSFEKHGIDIRVDHRSHKDRGINLTPSIKRGASFHMEKRGVETRKQYEAKEIQEENFQKITESPETILTKLSQERTSFTLNDAANEVIKYVPIDEILSANDEKHDDFSKVDLDKVMSEVLRKNAVFDERAIASELNVENIKSAQFVQILESIKGSDKIMYLGVGDDGRDRYTTKEFFQREARMQNKVDKLALRMNHFVEKGMQTEYLINYEEKQQKNNEKFKLTDEQKNAYSHLLSSGDICCLTGKAGTGKTTVLEPAVTAWKDSGYHTIGLSIANVAANALDECGFNETKSIASLFHGIDEYGYNPIDKKSVVVVDEASMVGSEHLSRLVGICKKVGAKLVLVGDSMQLSGVVGGAPFRAIVERIGSALLSNVIRQEIQWMRDASFNFAIGNIKAGLQAYHEHGRIHFGDTDDATKKALLKDWTTNPLKANEKIIAAHENEDVNYLNKEARQALIDNGTLGKSYSLTMLKYARGKAYPVKLDIAQNDRIIVSSRGYVPKKIMSNNEFGTISNIKLTDKGSIDSISILLDGKKTPLTFTAKEIKDEQIVLGRGYAATAHKLQGATKLTLFPYLSRMMDRTLTYVMMTRHKKDCHVYASYEQFKDFDALALRCGKAAIKDSVLDFAYNFSLRRGLDAENLIGIKRVFTDRVINSTTKVKDFFMKTVNPEKYEAIIINREKLEQQRIEQEKIRQGTEIKRENAKVVAKYRDLNSASGRAWAEVAKQAKQLGHWDYLDGKPMLQQMADSDIYKDAIITTNNANKVAAKIVADIEKYQEVLLDAGISVDSLKDKEEKHNLTKTIKLYQLDNQEKLLYANQILSALNENIKLYPQIKDANLDMLSLKNEAHEYKRLQYLESLEGEKLDGFILCNAYNDIAKETANLYKEIQGLIKHDLESEISHPETKEVIEALSKKHEELRLERNEAAYKVYGMMQQDKESIELGLKFFNIENWEAIQELEATLDEVYELPPHIDKEKRVEALEKQISYYATRLEGFTKQAKTHKSLLALQEYQKTNDSGVAAKIRDIAKNEPQVYFQAKDMGINWNTLISKGEGHSYANIENTLNAKDNIKFKEVRHYLELTRTKGTDYYHNMELKYYKTLKAYQIVENIEDYKEALRFFHIAIPNDDGKYTKHEISQLEYLQKQAKIYKEAITLVEQYKKTDDVDKSNELLEQITKFPYGSHQETFLHEQFGEGFAKIGRYSDLVLETKLCYKNYIKAEEKYKVTQLDASLKDDRTIIYDNVKDRIYKLTKNIDTQLTLDKVPNCFGQTTKSLLKDNAIVNIASFEERVEEKIANMPELNINSELLTDITRMKGSTKIEVNPEIEKTENCFTMPTIKTYNEVMALRQEWQSIQGERNQQAHALRKEHNQGGLLEVGTYYYQLQDNSRQIAKIDEQLTASDIDNRQKLERQRDRLVQREDYIEKHAEIEDCNLLMQDYQKYKEKESKKAELVASSIRQMCAKGYYGVCFGMAQNRDINWNELLTTGEKFDREEINPTLSDEQHQAFDKVAKYLEIDRAKTESFNDLTKAFHQKAVICKEIFANLDKYKEALEFYQIATSKDKFNKHEIKASDRMTKYSDNYNKVLELIDNYKQADSKDKQELAKQLSDKPLTLIREGYLNSSNTLKDLKADIKNTLISGKLQDAIERNVHGASRVLKYVEAVYESRLLWSALSQLEFDSDTAKSIKKLAIQTNKERNQAAWLLDLAQLPDKEAIAIGQLSMKQIEKHANLYREDEISKSLENPKEAVKEYLSTRKHHIEIFKGHGVFFDGLQVFKDNTIKGKALTGISKEVRDIIANDTKWLAKAEEFVWQDINREDRQIDAERVAKAVKITKNTVPVKMTSCKKYLESRGITINVSKDVVAANVYEPETKKSPPAIVGICRDRNKNITAVQAIYLENGKKLDIEVGKRTFGVLKHSSVLVHQGDGNRIAICEGIETALSVAQVQPELTVHAVLGSNNFANFELNDNDKGKDIILCVDNDNNPEKTNALIKEAAENLSLQGSDIYAVIPPSGDFNDMLRNKGFKTEKISRHLDRAAFVAQGVTKYNLAIELKQGYLEPNVRVIAEHEFTKLSADDIYQKALTNLTNNNPHYHHKYFIVYQANRISQDVVFMRNQYNKEPTPAEMREIIKRAEFEAKALEADILKFIKENKNISKDDMWNYLIEAREVAARTSLSFVRMSEGLKELETLDSHDFAEGLMKHHLEDMTKEELPLHGYCPKGPERVDQLIEYHTSKFIGRYGVEPNEQSKQAIEDTAKRHDSQLAAFYEPDRDTEQKYLACTHAESVATESVSAVAETRLVPEAFKELTEIEKTLSSQNMTRDDLNKVRDALDVENLIDDVNIDDIKEKTRSKGKELEM